MKSLHKQKGFAALIPLIGAGISAAASYFGAEDTNDTNVMLANQNRSWQEEMSNTAHQREVKDLTAAGLNPILSVNKSGASTPGGNVPIVMNPWQNALSGATDAARAYADIKKKQQDYNIDKPKEQIMDEAGKHIPTGLNSITESVSAAVSAAVATALKTKDDVAATPMDAVANAAKKLGEAVSQTSATSAGHISNITTEYARRILDTVKAPESYFSKFINSAQDAHNMLSNRLINKRQHYSEIKGPPERIWDEINRIPNTETRAQVTRAYRQQLNREGR